VQLTAKALCRLPVRTVRGYRFRAALYNLAQHTDRMSYSADSGESDMSLEAAAPVIVLGSSGARLSLQVLRRLYVDCADYWDGNWIACRATVAAGAFSGRVDAELRTDELDRFAAGLDGLYRTLSGEAVLASMDFWIDVVVKSDGIGHFSGECWLRDQPGVGSQLEFEIAFDQTEIPAIVGALRETLVLFPVIGDPNR
jgi:hypothetical protein